LVLDIGVKVIMTSGNHDSPDRLGFASTIMRAQGLHISADIRSQDGPVVIEDEDGPVHFYPLPYAEPVVVREHLNREEIRDHNSAMGALIGKIKRGRTQGTRSVLIAHAFVTGGTTSESERPLTVGGTGLVDAACFDGFEYVALGHLHRPQQVHKRPVYYSGSLLKYSFSEAGQEKGMLLVELDGKGACSIEKIPLRPKHDVREISGCLEDLLDQPPEGPERDDFLSVTLLDTGALYDPMGKLREVYPNTLEIKRPAVTDAGQSGAPRVDHRKMTEAGLFESFYREATGEPLSTEQREAFVRVVDRMRREDRETDS
jgi:exonuclease SbcD